MRGQLAERRRGIREAVGAEEQQRGQDEGQKKEAAFPSLSPLEAAERAQILQMLRTTSWNLSRAAQLLGIDRKTLRTKIHRYGLVTGNPALIRSLRWTAHRPLMDETDAAAVIIRELWKKLRATHPLRGVK